MLNEAKLKTGKLSLIFYLCHQKSTYVITYHMRPEGFLGNSRSSSSSSPMLNLEYNHNVHQIQFSERASFYLHWGDGQS
ncbi:hypothetical protein BLOT_012354 [Blomia tropicalis]|nr:hypothetical protein BLOT_012354 [Blomia tropicalis]